MNEIVPHWRRHDGGLVAHSIDIASFFDKRHDHVVRDIEELLSQSPKLGTAGWFVETTYRSPTGQRLRAYQLSFEGFALLVMGWTGPKALEFKIAWIEAFKAQGGIISLVTEYLPATFTDERRLLDLIRDFGDQGGRIEDLQQRVLEVVRGIDNKTSLISDGVTSLRGEVRSRRREFSEGTKRELIWATRMLGRRCPCCGTVDVVLPNGDKATGAEFDHFFSNHFANPDSGWLICGDCHYRLTNSPALRHDVTPEFKAFQNKRKALGSVQGGLWQ